MRQMSLTVLIVVFIALSDLNVLAHDGPDPISHWVFNSRSVNSEGVVTARLGPDGKLSGDCKIVDDEAGQSVLLSGNNTQIEVSQSIDDVRRWLPEKAFTVSTWVSINKRQNWGAVLSLLQDNGSFEKGFVVGYDKRKFYFGLATSGADDGDGKMTYLKGETDYELGKFYHVTATYDGSTMSLYVNGKLDGTSDEQSGTILFPKEAVYSIGAYKDDDEFFPHSGRIRDMAVYELSAKPAWIEKEFKRNETFTNLDARGGAELKKLELVIKPYLQFVTQTGITVMAQTNDVASAEVRFGETAECTQSVKTKNNGLIHEIKLTELKPNTQYFYKLVASNSRDETAESEIRTFQTAPDKKQAYAFAVISDTQSNPKVAKQIAELAWNQRPSFLIHPGDLVGTGTDDSHWTQQFFPSMEDLISRVAFFPVLGNHELNARNYFDYMSLPDPEYYYEFQYGNAHFFMVDSNRKVGSDSEQFKWLDEALGASTSKWKFVVHHHPPYSSDENDYGNLWKTNKSTQGDLRVRELCQLYDKHRVDIVFNGHIHSYERTWPVKDQEATAKGTVYMVTGGGGGSLETPGPKRTFFQHNVRRGHHYCMVHINDGELELKAFDLEGQLFDLLKLSK